MAFAKERLNDALVLLDELDATPLSEINKKLDRIADAVTDARTALIRQEREERAA